MKRLPPYSIRIIIVDPRPRDFALFDELVDAGRLTLHFFTHGFPALRDCHEHRADLWMINVALPDIAGFDLFEMILQEQVDIPVFLVGQTYRAEDELRALRLGAAKYLCKPASLSWISTLRRPQLVATGSERLLVDKARHVVEPPVFYPSLDDT